MKSNEINLFDENKQWLSITETSSSKKKSKIIARVLLYMFLAALSIVIIGKGLVYINDNITHIPSLVFVLTFFLSPAPASIPLVQNIFELVNTSDDY